MRPLRRFCVARDNFDLSPDLIDLRAGRSVRLCDLAADDRRDLVFFAALACNRRPPPFRDSAKEWLRCIFCFSLSASALVCLVLWLGGLNLNWEEWVLSWLSFSAVTLIINQALMCQN